MDEHRRKLAEDLFQQALDLDPAERETFLEAECPDDALRAEVEGLITHYEAGRDLFELLPAPRRMLQERRYDGAGTHLQAARRERDG